MRNVVLGDWCQDFRLSGRRRGRGIVGVDWEVEVENGNGGLNLRERGKEVGKERILVGNLGGFLRLNRAF